MKIRTLSTVLTALAAVSTSNAQWDPGNGEWGKEDPRDLRVMTWNVQDAICRTNHKTEGLNNWTSIARILAAMKPDILLIQEAGDNDGNGTGSGVDSVFHLQQWVMDLLFHGGQDIFNGDTDVTAWVQKYDPGYDLTNVFASVTTDGFNRNVIVSKYPFVDLNGDGRTVISDIFPVLADTYAPGGLGGIRGFQFAEIDLPDSDYLGNLVIGNAHLKAGSTSSNHDARVQAAKNTTYFIDYLFNGAGTGTPDPNEKILDSPTVTDILDDSTPVIYGGDWNEDEQSNGQKGPADWLTRAEFTGGTDGPDRDRSDAVFDDAREPFTNNPDTRGSSKLDYVSWQDSIATLRRAFIFDSVEADAVSMPLELADMDLGGTFASNLASDHLPVIADFILPDPPVVLCPPDLDGDGDVRVPDLIILLAAWGPNPGHPADLDADGEVRVPDLIILLAAWGACA